jgi:adenine-specific DNA methylase
MQTRTPHLGQRTLFEDQISESKSANSSTFVDNMSLPVHRWFRYSAGFSALWVRDTIRSAQQKGEVRVLDPFAGSGTVLVEAENAGVPSFGVESHPFVARIADVKIRNGFKDETLRE